MDRGDLRLFVRFHAWANSKIIETAGALSDEELRADGVLDHGSAFQTLRHLVDVDWSWREFAEGRDPGQTYVWDLFPMDDLPRSRRSASRRTCGWRRTSTNSTRRASTSRSA